ncbi:MAG: ABC transporter permease [Thermotogaceae bacterium]|nr:ABC transporter permease [Thermotogaceae bacterium]
MAGNSTARRLVEKKETPSLVSAVVVSLLWAAVFVAIILSSKTGYFGFYAKAILLPAIAFYLFGYSIGARIAKKLIRIYGHHGFKKEGKVESALWTFVIPALMVLVVAAIDVIIKYIPLNQFINPELWRTAPFSSQEVFIKLLWSAFFVIIAVMVAFAAQAPLKTVKSKKIAFWLVILISLAAMAIWWTNAAYVDPKAGQIFKMGRYAVDIIMHMILPILTLTILSFAGSMLVMRDTMLEIIKEDYITTAKAKGLPDKVVRDKHAARNALLPLITNFVISLGFTVSGGIITETMFSWPGMGLAYLQALNEQDVPLLTGLLTFTGIFVLFAHLVADILYAFLDPRIRY